MMVCRDDVMTACRHDDVMMIDDVLSAHGL